MELSNSQWGTLDRDRKELAEAIKCETGLIVTGWTHVGSGCGKPEFEEGVSVAWDRIGALALGLLLPPGPPATSGPVKKKTTPKRKSKKGGEK